MAIVLHPLVDLSKAWPPFFVENLREVYTYGTGNSGIRFQALRNQVVKSLPSAPPPGPATFIVKCLEALVHVAPPHDEGLSHMLISALCQLDQSMWPDADASIARRLAGSLFCKALVGKVKLETRIVIKLPAAFGFDLKDVGDILNLGQGEEELQVKAAKDFMEHFLLDLLKRRSYTAAVSLIKHFNLQTCDYQSLIATIIDEGQANLAIDWAAHLGEVMLKFLVQHCTKTGLYKVAYNVVQQHKLEADFPDAYYLYKKSSLRKLVGKGLWDVAQSIAEGDTYLIDSLVSLAVEDNNVEKVMELCEQFNLDHVSINPDLRSSNGNSQYLKLESLLSEDRIHWIDTHEGLVFAERALFGVKLVGIDCEWKADSVKCARPNKVSILQVASSDLVLVLDLMSLFHECPSSLSNFIKYLFHASDILKLGYAIHNDLQRLSRSFMEIDAFRLCNSVLDLQSVFGKQIKGGLSGLAKEVLGNPLNKQVRMSDWETRPLSKKQLHYAALDAAVLLSIFNSHAQPTPFPEAQVWESHLTSYSMMCHYKGNIDSGRSMEDGRGHGTVISPHEDLVMASCELLGIPIPGLMKTELFEFTRAAKLPPPIFTTTTFESPKKTAFHSTVKVANTTFSGHLASSKKDAEFWAAQAALTKFSIGVNKAGKFLTSEEPRARGLCTLRVCGKERKFFPSRTMQNLSKRCHSINIWKGVYSNHLHTCIQAFHSIRSRKCTVK